MNSTTTAAPFSRAVVNAMRKLYPEALADKSWDNTGLLLEAPFDPARRQSNSVLLTVDLTKAVADEAIERKSSVVIAYHPIIFRGLKSITLGDTQQRSLLRLAAAGISVYSPHTAIDAAAGGLGDWLADIVTGTPTRPTGQDESTESSKESSKPSTVTLQAPGESDPFVDSNSSSSRTTYTLQHQPSGSDLRKASDAAAGTISTAKHTREPIKALDVPSHPGAGMGRIVRFDTPQPLSAVIERVAHGVGNPKGFPIAIPQNQTVDTISIRSVGICAGSGGSLFQGLDVDMLFTGELSHHEALAAIERGQVVIALFHSNTERGFLHDVLRGQLLDAVRSEWETLRGEEKGKTGVTGDVLEALSDESIEVEVSEVDRDPYGILISKSEV